MKKTIETPVSLQGDAIAEETWYEIMAKVTTENKVNLDEIERYALYMSVYQNAYKDVMANGSQLKAPNGIMYKNPALATMNQADTHLMKLGKCIWHLVR